MDFLCDVHISYKLSKHLSDLGHNSEHVNRILDKWNTTDKDIANYVDKNNAVLISKDSDFQSSHILFNSPKKLIKINLGNISNTELIEIFSKHITAIEKLDKSSEQYIIEIDKHNISYLSTNE